MLIAHNVRNEQEKECFILSILQYIICVNYLKHVLKLSETGRLRTISYFLSDAPDDGPYNTIAPSRYNIGKLPNESVFISTTLAGVASPPSNLCNTDNVNHMSQTHSSSSSSKSEGEREHMEWIRWWCSIISLDIIP